jgi:DUF4097 and DUF4098 domain-containing protein YvlB
LEEELMQRIRTTAVAMALAFLSISAARAAEDTIRRSFNVAPGGTFTLDADVGDVTVRAGNTNTVSVEVVRKGRTSDLRDYEITFAQEGNDVHVRGKYDHSFRFFDFLSAHFTVTVPSTYNLHLATSGGDIKIADIHGEVISKTSGGDLDIGHIDGSVEARTSGGDVKLESAHGKMELHTSGGGIRVGNADGPMTAKTSGGSINIKRVSGDLVAHTSGGSIDIDEALAAVDASTSGGSIHARLSRQPHGDSKLSTSGGTITLTLPSNIAVDLDAHTSGGDVETDMPVTVLGKQTESTLNGRINGGGPKLTLRSSGGDIRVRKM